jgi:hypothetical protein
MSYAVLWNEDESPTHAGKLELGDESLLFDGLNGSSRVRREVPVAEVVSARIARGRGERIGGRPALVLARSGGRVLRLASLSGAGALHEVIDFVNTRRVGVADGSGGAPQAQLR